jgi:hypothetical protein
VTGRQYNQYYFSPAFPASAEYAFCHPKLITQVSGAVWKDYAAGFGMNNCFCGFASAACRADINAGVK